MQDFEVEMSVAATDSLPLHQAPPQGMEQPMANSNTVYQDATLVAKKSVISGRVLAQTGKRVMSKAKTSVTAAKTRLLRCCHPVVVS